MNILLLGTDERWEPLFDVLVGLTGHRVDRSDLTATAEGAAWDRQDAVIIAGNPPGVRNLVRSMLSAGKTVVLTPSSDQGSALAYELLAIAEDAPGRLLAGFFHRLAPRWRRFRTELQTMRDAATPRLLQFERSQVADGRQLLSRTELEAALLHDADLLRWLGGDFSRITCLLTGITEAGVSQASATLTGAPDSEATWTLRSDPAETAWRLTVCVGDASSSVDGPGPGLSYPPDAAALESQARSLLSVIEAAAAGDPDPSPGWMEAVRAFDVVDAARRSVRRRRTVEIAGGETSERRAFKTRMTAAGCGLLSFTFLGVVLALLVGAFADPRDAALRSSAAAGFVLEETAFHRGEPVLTETAESRLDEMSRRLRETPAEIIVEAAGEAADPLNAARRQAVVRYFETKHGVEVDHRVVVRPLTGAWFETFMTAVWIVIFTPLALFLLLQALIVVTRQS